MTTGSQVNDAASMPLSDRGWRTLALNGLMFLVLVNGALAVYAFREIGFLRAEVNRSLWRTEQRYQSVNAQVSFASDRRRLVLGIRDEIVRKRPELGVAGAYELASMVLDASDKFPSVDPLLLVSIGAAHGGFDAAAISTSGARGLYQLHPTTGRLLARECFRISGPDLVGPASPIGRWRIVVNFLMLGPPFRLPRREQLAGPDHGPGAVIGVSAAANGAGWGVRCLAVDAVAARRVAETMFSSCVHSALGQLPAMRRK